MNRSTIVVLRPAGAGGDVERDETVVVVPRLGPVDGLEALAEVPFADVRPRLALAVVWLLPSPTTVVPLPTPAAKLRSVSCLLSAWAEAGHACMHEELIGVQRAGLSVCRPHIGTSESSSRISAWTACP